MPELQPQYRHLPGPPYCDGNQDGCYAAQCTCDTYNYATGQYEQNDPLGTQACNNLNRQYPNLVSITGQLGVESLVTDCFLDSTSKSDVAALTLMAAVLSQMGSTMHASRLQVMASTPSPTASTRRMWARHCKTA